MNDFTRVVILAVALIAAGCGSAEDPEDRGNAPADLNSESVPPALPLPPESQPPGAEAPASPDTVIDY